MTPGAPAGTSGRRGGNGKGNMERCECCGGEFRRLRKYQKNYGDEESTVLVCANCFSGSLEISKDILENAGSIAFAITSGASGMEIQTSDGRTLKVTIE